MKKTSLILALALLTVCMWHAGKDLAEIILCDNEPTMTVVWTSEEVIPCRSWRISDNTYVMSCGHLDGGVSDEYTMEVK